MKVLPKPYDELTMNAERQIERMLDLPIGIGTRKNVRDVLKDINALKRCIATIKKNALQSIERKKEWERIKSMVASK
ncbi:MAG: hypothetical protein UZ04_CHB001001484 [Chlorobi bacterium OLB4]|jgi:hypothetical protein|nr:MAG: hypothetical protein UZ04_CHB001001484 [Chlorobi bacterium OLB4]MBV6399558.1 hypothetical protein [Ignavibacteria bacterium]RIK47817.1 MAG: hypothetical protein DCC60_09595 [Ignavibacteriota bacterium]